jgi:integrase/recombinase XerD
VRHNHILHNPASDLDRPKLEKRLPRAVLNEEEAERVMIQPDLRDPLGARDRAIPETFYSTGIRRMELVNLRNHRGERLRLAARPLEGRRGNRDRTRCAARRCGASRRTSRAAALGIASSGPLHCESPHP